MADQTVLLVSRTLAIHGYGTYLGEYLLEVYQVAKRKQVLNPQQVIAVLKLSSVILKVEVFHHLGICLNVSFHKILNYIFRKINHYLVASVKNNRCTIAINYHLAVGIDQ